jgi:hypothetical protein
VPTNDDFRIDLSFTGREGVWKKPIAIGVAIAGVIFIILTMTTSLAEKLLPMSDEYLQLMIPPAPDGGEALGLESLKHDLNEKTISISGTVTNRTDQSMSDVIAVVLMQDTTGRFPQTQEVPIMPTVLAPHEMGTFAAMATLQEKPGGYVVKFKFADGPFIPHKDERAPEVTITPQTNK